MLYSSHQFVYNMHHTALTWFLLESNWYWIQGGYRLDSLYLLLLTFDYYPLCKNSILQKRLLWVDIYRVKFIYIDKQLYCIKQYMIHQVENLITVLNDSHNIILNARKVVKHCSLEFVTEYFSIEFVLQPT